MAACSQFNGVQEELRALKQPYSKANPEHEATLEELWTLLRCVLTAGAALGPDNVAGCLGLGLRAVAAASPKSGRPSPIFSYEPNYWAEPPPSPPPTLNFDERRLVFKEPTQVGRCIQQPNPAHPVAEYLSHGHAGDGIPRLAKFSELRSRST
jgi:hypothetical protein